jgi:phage terminase large subunit
MYPRGMTQEVITKRVQLRGAARAVMACRDPEVLLAGPAGTGKSFAVLYKIHLMCLKNPGMRALIARKTHKSLTSTGLVTFREQVAVEAISAGLLKWYGGSAERPAQYTYVNGSVIVVGGMDQPDKIMSSEYDVIFIQEATDCTLDDWEKANSRLRNGRVSFQQLIADCNPQAPSHWLKRRCDAGHTTMLYSHHEDNPRLFDEAGQLTEYGRAYIARLDALTGARLQRLRYGKWHSSEGMIYEWNPEVHLVRREDFATTVRPDRLPLKWRRIWTIDFGYTNPFVWQQWAIDGDGRMYLEHEIYRTKRLVEDHAKEILDVVSFRKAAGGGMNNGRVWNYPEPEAVICDHDAEDRATLERHLGFSTVPATKTVSDGIQAFQKRLEIAGDGRPRMLICRDALTERDRELDEASKPLWFGDEIEGYVWKNPTSARPTLVPDEPRKEDDHSMDAGRYAVAYLDLQPMPGIRWLG